MPSTSKGRPKLPPRSYNALLADRAELEARYEARLRAAEEQASAQVVALDSQVGTRGKRVDGCVRGGAGRFVWAHS